MSQKMMLRELAFRVNRLMILGILELVIGILAVIAGILAPDTVLYGNIGVLKFLGYTIGFIAILVGTLTIASALGIPLGVIAEVLTVPFQLRLVTYLSAGKGIICFISLIWVIGSFSWTPFLFYLFATFVDFSITVYGRQLVEWLSYRAPPKMTFLKL